ncbi:MAG: hypothetical protein WCK89_22470 [bacterium]
MSISAEGCFNVLAAALFVVLVILASGGAVGLWYAWHRYFPK